MSRIKEIASLKIDLTKEAGNILALEMLKDPNFHAPENTKIIAEALINIGNYRIDGSGFSDEVSDQYSKWIEDIFSESDLETAHKLADAMFELPSKNAIAVAQRLHSKVINESLKASLLDAICYASS